MKYYLVNCKCGHVKLGHFIEKTFPIKASNGKEAASIARKKGRVKHHDKFAIIWVQNISKEEYFEQKRMHETDEFFKVHSIQEQRANCPEVYSQTKLEEKTVNYKKSRIKQRLIEESKLKEIGKYKSYLKYE